MQFLYNFRGLISIVPIGHLITVTAHIVGVKTTGFIARNLIIRKIIFHTKLIVVVSRTLIRSSPFAFSKFNFKSIYYIAIK